MSQQTQDLRNPNIIDIELVEETHVVIRVS